MTQSHVSASPLESTVKLHEVLQISSRISTKPWHIHREMSAANRQKNIRIGDATAWNTDSPNWDADRWPQRWSMESQSIPWRSQRSVGARTRKGISRWNWPMDKRWGGEDGASGAREAERDEERQKTGLRKRKVAFRCGTGETKSVARWKVTSFRRIRRRNWQSWCL